MYADISQEPTRTSLHIY